MVRNEGDGEAYRAVASKAPRKNLGGWGSLAGKVVVVEDHEMHKHWIAFVMYIFDKTCNPNY